MNRAKIIEMAEIEIYVLDGELFYYDENIDRVQYFAKPEINKKEINNCASKLISSLFIKMLTTGNKVFDSMLYNRVLVMVEELINENKLKIRKIGDL